MSSQQRTDAAVLNVKIHWIRDKAINHLKCLSIDSPNSDFVEAFNAREELANLFLRRVGKPTLLPST